MKPNEEKKDIIEETKKEEVVKKMRKIVIETNGDDIHLVSADVAGKLELMAVLEALLKYLNTPQK